MQGGIRKTLTFNERKEIEKYIKQGESLEKISIIIGRSKTGVQIEVKRSGGRDNYNADQAQKDYIKRKQVRYEKLSEKNKKTSKSYHWTSRIQNLEMQIEILHDTVKELMNAQKN